MYILLALNIFGVALMLYKFFGLGQSKKKYRANGRLHINKSKRNSFENTDHGAKVEIAMRELAAYMSAQEKGLNTVKIIATISPLLGLLGTVLGVLLVQQDGCEWYGRPDNFASGISLALIINRWRTHRLNTSLHWTQLPHRYCRQP